MLIIYTSHTIVLLVRNNRTTKFDVVGERPSIWCTATNADCRLADWQVNFLWNALTESLSLKFKSFKSSSLGIGNLLEHSTTMFTSFICQSAVCVCHTPPSIKCIQLNKPNIRE